jgi:hypothetical protein
LDEQHSASTLFSWHNYVLCKSTKSHLKLRKLVVRLLFCLYWLNLFFVKGCTLEKRQSDSKLCCSRLRRCR